MKPDAKAKQRVCRLYEGFGMVVRELKENSIEKVADIEAFDGSQRFIVEIKEKSHDINRMQKIDQQITHGDVASDKEGFARRNAIASHLNKSAKQLLASDKDGSSIRLVWMELSGHDADLRWQQAYATFYGSVHVFALDGQEAGADHCLYFDHSSAYAHPEIDGLFLIEQNDLNLCLNEYSENYERVKSTRLVQLLRDGVIDPIELVDRGIAVALKSSVARNNDAEVECALSEQAGVEYRSIRFHRYSSYAFVRKS